MLGLIITAALISLASAQTCNDTYSSLCTDHIMCEYPNGAPSANCQPPVCSGVGNAYISVIVDFHNDVRRKVARGLETRGLDTSGPQPPAANMRNMTWDTELAKIAQQWAYQCTSGYDKCRNVPRFLVNQNTQILPNGPENQDCTENWEEALKKMYDGVDSFSNTDISPFVYKAEAEQYTQMVWADTYTVGCGFTAYSSDSDNMYNKLYVCNYGPGGNYKGGSMYKIGAPCTECPSNAPICEVDLCMPEK